MTAADDSLLDLAVPYALHALTDAERDGIDSRLGGLRSRCPRVLRRGACRP